MPLLSTPVLALLVTMLGLGGCGTSNAPSQPPLVSSGAALMGGGTLGTVVRIYSGTQTGGGTVTMQQDAAGVLSVAFTTTLHPSGAAAYPVQDTFVWNGITGLGIFYLPDQGVTVADPVTPLQDRDDASGVLTLTATGTFTLTLNVTGQRYPTGAAPAQTTSAPATYTGTWVAAHG